MALLVCDIQRFDGIGRNAFFVHFTHQCSEAFGQIKGSFTGRDGCVIFCFGLCFDQLAN